MTIVHCRESASVARQLFFTFGNYVIYSGVALSAPRARVNCSTRCTKLEPGISGNTRKHHNIVRRPVLQIFIAIRNNFLYLRKMINKISARKKKKGATTTATYVFTVRRPVLPSIAIRIFFVDGKVDQ